MNSSKRWAYHFVSALECVRCRVDHGLTLYHYNKKPIDSEAYSVNQLKAMIPYMDVWCDNCEIKINTRVTGSGRLKHKEEAAYIADLKTAGQHAGTYDEHVLENGKVISKKELIERVKSAPCAVCGIMYPSAVYDFHHVGDDKIANVSSMMGPRYTIQSLIEEIEKCALVCANCHRLLTAGIIKPILNKIEVNENILLSAAQV